MQGTGWGGLPRNRLCLGRLLKKRSAASQTTQAKHRCTSATEKIVTSAPSGTCCEDTFGNKGGLKRGGELQRELSSKTRR